MASLLCGIATPERQGGFDRNARLREDYKANLRHIGKMSFSEGWDSPPGDDLVRILQHHRPVPLVRSGLKRSSSSSRASAFVYGTYPGVASSSSVQRSISSHSSRAASRACGIWARSTAWRACTPPMITVSDVSLDHHRVDAACAFAAGAFGLRRLAVIFRVIVVSTYQIFKRSFGKVGL